MGQLEGLPEGDKSNTAAICLLLADIHNANTKSITNSAVDELKRRLNSLGREAKARIRSNPRDYWGDAEGYPEPVRAILLRFLEVR